MPAACSRRCAGGRRQEMMTLVPPPGQSSACLLAVYEQGTVRVRMYDQETVWVLVRIRARVHVLGFRVYEYGSRDFAGRFGLDFSMAVVAVPFILYLVRFCSSKSCKHEYIQYLPTVPTFWYV